MTTSRSASYFDDLDVCLGLKHLQAAIPSASAPVILICNKKANVSELQKVCGTKISISSPIESVAIHVKQILWYEGHDVSTTVLEKALTDPSINGDVRMLLNELQRNPSLCNCGSLGNVKLGLSWG